MDGCRHAQRDECDPLSWRVWGQALCEQTQNTVVALAFQQLPIHLGKHDRDMNPERPWLQRCPKHTEAGVIGGSSPFSGQGKSKQRGCLEALEPGAEGGCLSQLGLLYKMP